jgi:TonB family protein
MNAAVEQASYTPIFNWDAPRDRRVLLGGLIVASAILHALCFYVFQIVYPPTVALLPAPARVSVINASTEEGRLLLQWIAAEDPALASTTVRPPDAPQLAPPAAVHVPSFVGRAPQLQDPPPYEPDLSVRSPQPPGPVPTPRHAAPAPAPVAPTTITITAAGAEGESCGVLEIGQLQFTTSSREPPVAAQFRVAVDPHGVVRHCFVERSSGDASLDDQARQQLLRARFPAAADRAALSWFTATIHWGSDVPAPAPPPAAAAP